MAASGTSSPAMLCIHLGEVASIILKCPMGVCDRRPNAYLECIPGEWQCIAHRLQSDKP